MVCCSGLKNDSCFYMIPDKLRRPLIFYYAHPATLYVNKMKLAGLVADIDPFLQVATRRMQQTNGLSQTRCNRPSAMGRAACTMRLTTTQRHQRAMLRRSSTRRAWMRCRGTTWTSCRRRPPIRCDAACCVFICMLHLYVAGGGLCVAGRAHNARVQDEVQGVGMTISYSMRKRCSKRTYSRAARCNRCMR